MIGNAIAGFIGVVATPPAQQYIAIPHDASPFVTAYPWNSGTGFGTKLPNPASLPAGRRAP
jgi:hypothetical protein